MKLYHNVKTIKMFNACYTRACFHHRKKTRKKNYHRAKRMLLLSNYELRHYVRYEQYGTINRFRAKKLIDSKESYLNLY